MPLPILRIPPFPGHCAGRLAVPGHSSGDIGLVDALRSARVGGSFWGVPGNLPSGRDVLICASNAGEAVANAVRDAGLSGRAVTYGSAGSAATPGLPADCDPWDTCANASLVVADADCEIALVAALVGKPLEVVGTGRFADLRDPAALETVVLRELCTHTTYHDPFTGDPMPVLDAIALLGRWRALIEANRVFLQIHGVARWKQITADALLWDGTGPVRHVRSGDRNRQPATGDQVLAWRTRSDPAALAAMEGHGVRVGELEDGMIRSTGLGANCVPPLSIVVDAAGPHFDPAQPSALETILEHADIDDALLARAARLRETLVRGGISKYEHDAKRPVPVAATVRADGQRLVLVTGQVEDDRSVLLGGAGLDNLQLLRHARAIEPDAHIVFKPHPDVEAGHRRGHVPDALARELADEIDRTSSMAALLDRVDAVHVLTSLAGFEALMRGREVVTHGVPFYAGWGLTRDVGPVPDRRTRRRSLDELVAATLILYPRYLDPVTRLPCEPEVLVQRIAAGEANVTSPLIRLRELQGRMKRLLDWRSRR